MPALITHLVGFKKKKLDPRKKILLLLQNVSQGEDRKMQEGTNILSWLKNKLFSDL